MATEKEEEEEEEEEEEVGGGGGVHSCLPLVSIHPYTI